MKAFYKVCIRLAIGVCCLGMVLVIVGFACGASWKSMQLFRRNDFRISRNLAAYDSSRVEVTEVVEEAVLESSSEQNDYNNGSYQDYNNGFYQETFSDPIQSIEIDIPYGEVFIRKGDRCRIEAENIDNHNFQSYIDGDTWIIEDDTDYGIDFFRSDFFNNDYNEDKKCRIDIYIPEGFYVEDYDISLGAGSLKADDIEGGSITLEIGAGTFHADRLVAREDADIVVETGEVVVQDMALEDASIQCAVGNINMNGVINGDSSITCEVGSVSLALKGNEKDYNYYVDCGVGNVIINGDQYGFTSSTELESDYASKDFTIDCGVGSVIVEVR